ncbi:MAG: hypothetical protein U9Q82_14735, partial [Chloroflexota bacterium]|nr:hypothetical protein [Chloroflexota bacterium]
VSIQILRLPTARKARSEFTRPAFALLLEEYSFGASVTLISFPYEPPLETYCFFVSRQRKEIFILIKHIPHQHISLTVTCITYKNSGAWNN